MIEPPTWVPIATGTMLAPTAATVWARITAPAWRSAQTPALSRLGKLPFIAAQPISVGMSFVSSRSLMATGMPSIGDIGEPAFQRAALASAAARAPVVDRGESFYDGLARRNGLEAALQIGAR